MFWLNPIFQNPLLLGVLPETCFSPWYRAGELSLQKVKNVGNGVDLQGRPPNKLQLAVRTVRT